MEHILRRHHIKIIWVFGNTVWGQLPKSILCCAYAPGTNKWYANLRKVVAILKVIPRNL